MVAHEFGRLTLKGIEVIAWPIPLICGMFVDCALNLRLGISNGIHRWRLWRIKTAVRAWTPRCGTKIHWYVIALANAAGGKSEPVWENSTAFVVRIISQQTMKSVLLLTTTTIATEHLLEFMSALLPVYILLERIKIEQG